MIEGYLVTKKINQAERQHLASIFESIDEDHSGIIEVEEFKKFYQDNSEYYNGEEMEALLLTLDKNKSGKIDFNEFISAMCSRRKLFQLESLSEAFDFVDRDGSGEISR
jgi:Ca2+-binding EF-hand superfamily protein